MAKKPTRRAGGAVELLDNDREKQGRDDSPAAKDRRAYKHWMDEIKASKKVFEDYHKRGKKIVRLYKDDRKNTSEIMNANDRMNILWSNTETLKPALYSQTPNPNVSRRFMDGDPVSRTASMILERCLVTAVELADFNYPMMRARDDYLLPGRGTVWVRYAPTMAMLPMQEPVTKIDMGEAGSVYRPFKGGDEIPAEKVQKDEDGLEYYETDPVEQVLAHGLDVDHLLWSDFLHEAVNDWTKVGWIAKRIDMKRPKLIKEFGEQKGRKIACNKVFNAQAGDERDGIAERGKPDCAEVWEIWSKDHNCVYWISDGLPDVLLKQEEDPLGLTDFWPMPRPLFATTTTDSLIPVPDYSLYQDQAEQLDLLTDRIRRLIKALRVVGVYNAALEGLSRLLDEADENEMIPVADWVAFAQNNGLKGNLDWLPIEQIASVLTQLFQARAQIKQDLYEVTGISDVIRGATAPEETATAQQIKSNFANLRLKARQDEMARFARDTLRKMAEIIAEHFPEEELIEMSGVMSMDEFRMEPPTGDPQKDAANKAKYDAGVQRVKQAVALLKSDKLRTFKVDIETDATVAPDQKAEKEARVEFLTAVTPFIEKAAQVGATAPQLVPLLMKMLDFGVKGFRAGRTLEAAIEETIQTAEKMLTESDAAGPQQAPPDPVAEAQAQELQAKTQKVTEELTQLQAAAQVKAQENEAKRLEAEERKAREAETWRLSMMKLNESIQTSRDESARQIKLLELQIAKAELELEQLRTHGGIEEIRGMIPQDAPARPEPTAQELEAHQVDMDVKRAQARERAANAKVTELQAQLAELRFQHSGMDGLAAALGEKPVTAIGGEPSLGLTGGEGTEQGKQSA